MIRYVTYPLAQIGLTTRNDNPEFCNNPLSCYICTNTRIETFVPIQE